jgi:hypothetical protein
MGFTARTKLAAVLLDPKPLAAFLTLSDGITVAPLALPLTSYVLHGASHAASPITDGPQLWRARRPSLTRYFEALGGILVEFLLQQKPIDAECFDDLTATTAALV